VSRKLVPWGRAWTRRELDAADAMRLDGATLREIARALGRTPDAVRGALRHAGLAADDYRHLRAALAGWPQARGPRQAEALRALAESPGPLSNSDLAARAGLSLHSARHLTAALRRLGLVTRAGWRVVVRRKVPLWGLSRNAVQGAYGTPGHAERPPTRGRVGGRPEAS
jgi:DNA-binding CsgD family transcriptional regulator